MRRAPVFANLGEATSAVTPTSERTLRVLP